MQGYHHQKYTYIVQRGYHFQTCTTIDYKRYWLIEDSPSHLAPKLVGLLASWWSDSKYKF